MLLHIDYGLHTEDSLCQEVSVPHQMTFIVDHMF
jgi:hypothetical protein